MTYSKALEDALALLGQDPLPADAEARLDELEKQAPAGERDLWADIWEGFAVAQQTGELPQ